MIADVIGDATSKREKAERVYNYVRDNLEKKNRNSGIYVQSDQNKILELKKATNSERNLLMLMLLRAAGLKADPVLISTFGNGWLDPALPFLSQYNRTIVHMPALGKRTFLDASDRLTPFGMLPLEANVGRGLLLKPGRASFITIPPAAISRELSLLHIKINKTGDLEGKTRIRMTGNASRQRNRQLARKMDITKVINENICGSLDGFELIETDTTVHARASDSLNLEYTFKLSEFVEKIDGEVYLKPAILSGFTKNIFASPTREFPIEFGLRFENMEQNTFDLAGNYSVAELPESKTIDNRFFIYRRSVVPELGNPGVIKYSRTFRIKKIYIPAQSYDKVRDDFAKIVDADQEMIILKPVN